MLKIIKIVWWLIRYLILFLGIITFLLVSTEKININVGEKIGKVLILLWIASGIILFSIIKNVPRRLNLLKSYLSLLLRRVRKKRRKSYIPKSIRREVWRRDGGRCRECKSNKKLEFDHIIPISEGGGSTARNIQLLCEKCNRRKSNKI